MCSALEKLAATERRLDAPYLISILADTYRRNGRWAEAQVQLDEVLARVDATDERWYEAELHRLSGKVALGRGDVRGAEVAFDRAVTVARAQSAGMWALRAATSLASLWREAGKAAEARMMLEPILSGFTEGFDMADVMGAKSILKELAQLDQSA